MAYTFEVQFASNDAVGNHAFVQKKFNALVDAVNYVQSLLSDATSVSILNTTRFIKHKLTKDGVSKDEIYDITGDVDTNIPTQNCMTLFFAKSTKWTYCIGGTNPDIINRVPYIYVKIEKIENMQKIDSMLSAFTTMCL